MLAPILLGLAQGARHSLEPDHLATIAVLARDTRDAWRSAWLGALWGIGHTLSLLAMSALLLGFGAMLPPLAERLVTLAIAAFLVLAGVRALRPPPPDHPRRGIRGPLQALAIGAMHGLAGSSALTAAAFASLASSVDRVVFIALFGFGSIVGMATASGSAGRWLHTIQHPRPALALRIGLAVSSIAIGVKTGLGGLR